MAGAPPHIVKHDRAGQSLGFEEAFHELHRHQVALVGFGAGDDDLAVAFRPRVRVQQAFGEVAGRQQLQEPELVLPAQAIGLEFLEQVEGRKIALQLLARGRGCEVGGIGFLPVELDAAVLDESKRIVQPRASTAWVRSINHAWSTLCSLKPIG